MAVRPSPAASSTRNLRRPAPSSKPSLLEWCISHETLSFFVVSTLLVFGLYAKAIGAPFIYDDLDQIVNNPSLASWHAFVHRFLLAPVAFTTDFRGPGGVSYRPLYWLTLFLDRRLWQLNPAGFHLTNLMLHIANGLLGFCLLRRLRVSPNVSAAAALLWLCLPINTEVVAWISGRAYSLSGVFLLLGLLLANWHLRTGKVIALPCYFLAAIAALLSHEQGLLLLPLTLLIAYVTASETGQLSRRALLTLLSTSLFADLMYLVLKQRVAAHAASGSAAIWAFGLTFWKYVLWMLAPIHMSVERSTSTPANIPSAITVIAWLGLAALIAAIYLLRKSKPALASGLAWMCLSLAPFCGLVFIYQGMAERFTYMASAGLALSIVSLLLAYSNQTRRVLLTVILLWTTWGVWRLYARVIDWSDPASLYRNSLQATPNSSMLFYNLGFALREKGEFAEAEQAYRNAIRLEPRYQRAFSSLGDLYAIQRRPIEAQKAYNDALALKPDDVGTVLNLGVLFQQVGAVQAAEREFRRAIFLAPNDSAAYTNLGVLLYQQNKVEDAAKMFAKAIDNKSTDITPYYNLAALLQQAGRGDLALLLYKRVLEIKPNDPDTLANIQKLQAPR
ncbi:MAG TPA: tetratricopeptide repeat protein [Edaphobacter sp.]|nr:tetratricopeptide repeat protein [Edaphobacter sp.]